MKTLGLTFKFLIAAIAILFYNCLNVLVMWFEGTIKLSGTIDMEALNIALLFYAAFLPTLFFHIIPCVLLFLTKEERKKKMMLILAGAVWLWLAWESAYQTIMLFPESPLPALGLLCLIIVRTYIDVCINIFIPYRYLFSSLEPIENGGKIGARFVIVIPLVFILHCLSLIFMNASFWSNQHRIFLLITACASMFFFCFVPCIAVLLTSNEEKRKVMKTAAWLIGLMTVLDRGILAIPVGLITAYINVIFPCRYIFGVKVR